MRVREGVIHPYRALRATRQDSSSFPGLCTTNAPVLVFCARISCSSLVNLFKSKVLALQNGGGDFASSGRQHVAIGAGHFADQAVGAKHADKTGCLAGGPPLVLGGGETPWEEASQQLAVAKAIDCEFPSADCLQKRAIGDGIIGSRLARNWGSMGSRLMGSCGTGLRGRSRWIRSSQTDRA